MAKQSEGIKLLPILAVAKIQLLLWEIHQDIDARNEEAYREWLKRFRKGGISDE